MVQCQRGPDGTVLADPGESDLSFVVRVTDDQETASRYVATLFHEIPGDGELAICDRGERSTQEWRSLDSRARHLAGVHEAFLVRVRQVEAGTHVDDAWSAPIWIDPTGAVPTDDAVPAGFVKSKNSNIYHLRDCAIAKQIEANGNLVAHTPVAGDDTRLHKNCPTSGA